MCDNFFSGTGVPPGFGPIKSSFPGNKSGRDARSTARGYVLLLTLFLLVIAAVAMVGVARASMGRALAAVDARRELQQRWGTLSATRALLPRAATVIDEAEQRAGHPLPAVAATVELGGESFTLTFADEQAKANLNALYAAGKRPAAERAAHDASGGLSVRLRPMPVPEAPAGKAKRASEVDQILARLDAEESRQKKSGKPAKEADFNLDPALLEGDEDAPPPPPPAFVGFGQVFDAPPPDALRRATAALTLWGDGRADLRRAPIDVLERVCAPILTRGQVGKLAAARDAAPAATPAAALATLKLDGEKVKRLAARLSRQSACYSLWIDAGGRHHFAVVDHSGEGGPRTLGFDW